MIEPVVIILTIVLLFVVLPIPAYFNAKLDSINSLEEQQEWQNDRLNDLARELGYVYRYYQATPKAGWQKIKK